MAIPSYDFISKPYKDDLMDYDYKEHRYIPTIEGVKRQGYVDLTVVWRTPENAQSYLDLLSSVVYDVLLSKVDGSKNRDKLLYYMAHSKQVRVFLMDLFKDSVWYNQRDGGFMMAYNSGANLNQGKLIEFGIDKALSNIAHQKLKNSDLGNRALKYNLNDFYYFDDLNGIKVFMVDKGLMESDFDFDDIKDYPKNPRYVFRGKNAYGMYVIEDILTLTEKIIPSKKIYNSQGSW